MFTFNKIYYIYETRLHKQKIVRNSDWSMTKTPTQFPIWLMCNYLAIGEWSKWGFSKRFWYSKIYTFKSHFCDSWHERKTMWLYTPNHHLSKKATVMLVTTLCWQLFNVDTLKILVPGSWQNSVTNRSSPTQTNISCLQHRCSPKTKTLTENQFSIFFSFSPKLSPFLSFQNSIAFLLQVHCTTIWKKCQFF